MNDTHFMRRALSLARRAYGSTSPNPIVGAVLVNKGKIIAEGYHKKAGLPHAEAVAIKNAKGKTKGTTLYVNLEPCCHTDKRTPPCTDAIISAQIKKVFVAMKDPNPKVSGRGIKSLRDQGIDVTVGLMEKESKKLNEFYVKYITTRLPFVILKTAMTLDGKIATPTGESKWITSEKSRNHVHRMRGRVDAILSAIGTVKADNPLFTSRINGSKDPLRIIIDPSLEIPMRSNVLSCPPQTILITKKRDHKMDKLVGKGIKVIHYRNRLDLKDMMKKFGQMGVSSIMIEGGSSLAGHALEDGIVDKIMYFIAPKIIGGSASYPVVGGKSWKSIKDAFIVKDITLRHFGDDILIEGYLR
jgi:diaminohydroxyphosphoribosylaminopyrimidine deaminase/5-amino-6-(5-phosphoribosylamino)uracil reductase